MHYNTDDLEYFARLAAEKPKLREYLVKRYEQNLITVLQPGPDSIVQLARGRAAELRELITLLDSSKDQLEKLKSPRR